jgi:hypothetical protein
MLPSFPPSLLGQSSHYSGRGMSVGGFRTMAEWLEHNRTVR